ncbi:hypothetical protein GCM10009646_40750 [Streptomyces aureus]
MTGKPGTQTWYESVHVTCRSPESEAARKAENERIYAPRRERAEKANTEPATPVQAGGRAAAAGRAARRDTTCCAMLRRSCRIRTASRSTGSGASHRERLHVPERERPFAEWATVVPVQQPGHVKAEDVELAEFPDSAAHRGRGRCGSGVGQPTPYARPGEDWPAA